MNTQLTKWGNSQGIRLPRKLTQELGIFLNDFLRISVEDGRIIIEKVFVHRTLEERAADYGGKLGPYEAFDWGPKEGREVW